MTGLQRGGCLCGRVTFEASGAPLRSVHCHCAFCRRQTGGPVATYVGFERAAFTPTRGAAASYRSSPAVKRSFCRNCGSPLFFEGDGESTIYVVVGAFDDPNAFPPSCHVYAAQRLTWFDTADALPRHDGPEPGRRP